MQRLPANPDIPEDFQFWTSARQGLAATVLAATVIDVCSEGSTPIAADLLTRTNASAAEKLTAAHPTAGLGDCLDAEFVGAMFIGVMSRLNRAVF